MNYEEMSDAEINLSVARLMFVGYEMHIPYKHRNDVHVYHKDGGFVCASPDYCNNPSDAWPIIMSNKIGVWVRTGSTGEWIARLNMEKLSNGLLVVEYAMHQDPNPLRAAMIVFLMMKDAECQKS